MQEGETQKWMRLNGRTSRAMFPKRGSARMSVYSELWHYYWNWHVSMEIAAPYMVLMSRSQERGCWQLIIKGDWLARALHWGGGERKWEAKVSQASFSPLVRVLVPCYLRLRALTSTIYIELAPRCYLLWNLISMGRLLSQKEEETGTG